ncbi:hypothetical protein KKG45_07610 [bacterium]|nr:hypothetical protein [bacterium]MBU1073097.1 hypothetical protein [bacterium]
MIIRPFLDFMILCSQHPLFTSIGLLGLWLLTRRRSRNVLGNADESWRKMRPVLVIVTAGVFISFLTTCFWYMTHDGYASDVEAMVTTVAWWVKTGGQLYHAPDAAQQYSALYGPAIYLVTGFYLDLLGPSIFASKVGSLLSLYISLTLLYLTIRRWVSNTLALGLTTIAVLLYWTCGTSSMLVRADPYLLAAVCLGMYSAGSPRRVLAVAGSALGVGLAVNLKLHSLLYMLPVLTLLDEHHGWRATVAALGLGFVVVVAPFVLHDNISLLNYLSWLEISAHHGLELESLPHLLSRALFFAVPVLVPLSSGSWPADRPWMRRDLILVWIVGNLVVILLAMKPGAGQVHLLPIIPINMVFAARLWPAEGMRGLLFPDMRISWRLGAVMSFLIAAIVSGSVSGYRSARLASSLMEHSSEITAEIGEILATHPGRTISMGYGGDGQYFHWTNLRPLLIFAGQPLLLDAISIMDSRRAYREFSPATIDAIEAGVIDLWLVPRQQQPFSLPNWYPPHEEIFPEELRTRFAEHFRLEGRARFFDLWGWDRTASLGAITIDTAADDEDVASGD